MDVYTGFARRAIDRIRRIPGRNRAPWHSWVEAFALHQRGFESRVGFAKTGDNSPGERRWYEESNTLLNSIKNSLPAQEKRDCHLLIAANFGALSRLGVAGADARAVQALNFFRGAGGHSSNGNWSWTKELRGRFPERAFGNESRDYPEPDIRSWRATYRDHYWRNLEAAELPVTAADDGQLDPQDTHADDTGD
jgi:hypothetical protein